MRLRTRISIGLTALATAVAPLIALSPSASAEAIHDGSSSERAAASCWEVKQANPAAADGRYWLQTPQLRTPTQFYCDQTTDGGGWVLIGRGRHGWRDGGDGRGTPASVAWPITGPSAFLAKQLSGTTIDALLGGQRVDSLPDGIRVRRSSNQSGTTSQEIRFKFASRDRWSWALGADPGLAVTSYSVNGVTSTKPQFARDMTIGSDAQRTFTGTDASSKYVRGFLYGPTGPAGSASDSSYLYSLASDGRWAAPFSQLWIRPQLRTASLSYARVPDAGTPAQAALPLPDSGALPQPWGVTGLGRGGNLYYATEVSAFAQIGNRMYVGGNFTHVRSSDGSRVIAQPYLAAFDARTGVYLPHFRPRLNNQVKALAVLPNGRLAVGGQFTKVNGRTATALVALNPTNGQTYSKFRAAFKQSTKGAKRWVRTLDVSRNRLYVGGGFTSYRGGSAKKYGSFRNIVRVNTRTGRPDTKWLPNLGTGLRLANGKRSISSSVLSLDVSPDGKTVYAAGQFTQGHVGTRGKKRISAPGAAAIRTTKRATFRSWPLRYSTTKTHGKYQQAVKQVGNRVWLGGSQHSYFAYSTARLSLVAANLTFRGGDIQASASRGNVVFGSCHCNDWNYNGATNYDRRAAGFRQVDRIGYVGAWNASTGAFYPQFAPISQTRSGEGPWALFSAADGTLWSGGDYVSAVGQDGVNRWAGGFVRFGLRPHTPPAGPSNLRVRLTGSAAQISWTPSATRGASYEIIRNDRVVAVAPTGSTTVSIGDSISTDRWFVRATDGQGNRSASTAVARAASV